MDTVCLSHLKAFRQCILESRNYLVPSDFRRFMDKTKARAAFRYMDDNDSGRVGQSEVLAAVVQIFRCADARDVGAWSISCSHDVLL